MRTRLASFASALLVLVAPVLSGTAAAQVLNEVLYSEDPASVDVLRQHEWVEIHNPGASPVDLTGWLVADRDGAAGAGARTLPAVNLPAGAYLVLHFAAGTDDLDFTDGCGEAYTGDPSGADLFDATTDEAALYAPAGIVDFVAWHHGETGYVPGTAHGDAVAAGGWTAGAFLDVESLSHDIGERKQTVEPGTSIGRDGNSTDTDVVENWYAHGGVNARDITACRRNFDPQPLLAVPTPIGRGVPRQAVVPRKSWTVMLYSDADNNLETDMYGNLQQVESVGGSDDDINVVAMFDGKTTSLQVETDANGDLQPIAGTEGGTWRFQMGPQVDSRFIAMYTDPADDPFLGERDMGDPDELAEFITWAADRFPADRYALILSDHGNGWKGICGDDTSATGPCNGMPPPVPCGTVDSLYMGELLAALATAGVDLELIGFDACLMAMVEVGYQVSNHARYMVASEELEAGAGWPYHRWLPGLKANPGWTGEEVGREIVDAFHTYYSAGLFSERDPEHTLSLANLTPLRDDLVPLISALASDLRAGVDDFVTHNTPADNVATRLAAAFAAAERFARGHVNDFADLRHLAQLVAADAGIPDCYKTQLAAAIALTAPGGPVVLDEEHGSAHPNAQGLTIYAPRTRNDRMIVPSSRHQPYDFPSGRVGDESSRRAQYAPNVDELPLRARDQEFLDALAAPPVWPRVPSPSFLFPQDTLWDEFLQRFYHPVADNHIVGAFGPNGENVLPTVVDPVCGNPEDAITIYPGWTVLFSGGGASDTDSMTGTPTFWMWDFDDLSLGCSPCVAPYEVPDMTDADVATDDMDADQDLDLNRPAGMRHLDDEKQIEAVAPTFRYLAPGDHRATLNVWDVDHLVPFHRTRPTAEYVHPQTDSHKSLVRVLPRHFQCWEAHSLATRKAGVSLVDPFGPSTVDVVKPKRLCNPADKNDEDPTAPADPQHLTAYKIKQTTLNTVLDRTVTVDDQFGSLDVQLRRPTFLLVPSAKSHTAQPPPLPPVVDHFKCYRLKSAPFQVPGVKVVDQFGTLALDVKRPYTLCLAANKNNEGILAPDSHLLCYKVRRAQRAERPPAVWVTDQIAPLSPPRFRLTRPTELCVPATIR